MSDRRQTTDSSKSAFSRSGDLLRAQLDLACRDVQGIGAEKITIPLVLSHADILAWPGLAISLKKILPSRAGWVRFLLRLIMVSRLPDGPYSNVNDDLSIGVCFGADEDIVSTGNFVLTNDAADSAIDWLEIGGRVAGYALSDFVKKDVSIVLLNQPTELVGLVKDVALSGIGTGPQADFDLAQADASEVRSATGLGMGCNVRVTQVDGAYQFSASLPVGGSAGWRVGDTVKWPGTLLGGDTPDNDMTLTVAEIDKAGNFQGGGPRNNLSFWLVYHDIFIGE